MNTVTLPEQLTEKKQGKLTVFASYFTGAGKSYSMLESAEQARQAGLDVVIGLLSCEQWPQTQVLADKFEVLPCKTVIRDGQTNYEMDLDACLTRSPELILVNDLCPPSCRHWRALFLRYRRLVLHRVHKQNGQPDICGACQCQQDTENDTDDLNRFPQVTAGEDDPQQRQQQQHRSEPKRHTVHLLYTSRNASIISVNHFSSRAKRCRSCSGVSRPLPISKKPRPL